MIEGGLEGQDLIKNTATRDLMEGLKLTRKVGKIMVMLTPYNVSAQGFADRLASTLTGVEYMYQGKVVTFVSIFKSPIARGDSKLF